jgi:hypothetical protein
MPRASLKSSPSAGVLQLLRDAKQHSDRRQYAAKHEPLRRLLIQSPDDFERDSEPGRMVGITHRPTKFRIHMPRTAVPPEILLAWRAVPEQAQSMARSAAPLVKKALDVLHGQSDRPEWLWVDAYAPRLFALGAPEVMAKLAGVAELAAIETVDPEQGWVPVKTAELLVEDLARPALHAWQLLPNAVNRPLGGPTPLASLLAGGLLGAGLGYGGGWLAEKVIGDDVLRPGRLRRTAAILGGLAGALPGAAVGALGQSVSGRGLKSWVEPNLLFEKKEAKLAAPPELDGVEPAWHPFLKQALNEAGGLFMPDIPVDEFNRTIWQDPRTPLPVRAGASGLLQGAAAYQGGADLISPADIGRLAVGMGSGWLSGRLVGRTLGLLAGLRPETQDRLQQAGMWAGLLTNVVPLAYRAQGGGL